jgi:hypothetical protein
MFGLARLLLPLLEDFNFAYDSRRTWMQTKVGRLEFEEGWEFSILIANVYILTGHCGAWVSNGTRFFSIRNSVGIL